MTKTLVEVEVKDGDIIDEILRLGRETAQKRGDSNCVICAQQGWKIIHPPEAMVLLHRDNRFDGVCLAHYKGGIKWSR